MNTSMNAVNYLCYAAKQAAGQTNYFVVVRDKIIAQGPDLRAALNQDVRGAKLYTLFEPNPEELLLASNAGVRAVYFALSKHDAVRLGVTPLVPWWVPPLVPRSVRYARETILRKWNVWRR